MGHNDQVNTGCAIVTERVEHHRAGQSVDRLPTSAVRLAGTVVLTGGTAHDAYRSHVHGVGDGIRAVGVVVGLAGGASGTVG